MTITASLGDDKPPSDMSPPLQALWWLRKGDFEMGAEWDRAHEICQGSEGVREYDWIHALSHRIEGDAVNADYWYRRAGESQYGADAADEWAHLVRELGG